MVGTPPRIATPIPSSRVATHPNLRHSSAGGENCAHENGPHGKLRPHRAYPRRLQCKQGVAGVHLSAVTFGGYSVVVNTLLKRMVGDSANGERVLRTRLGPAAAVTWSKRNVLSKFLCDEPDAHT